jgi:hypothetical protein
MSVIGAVDPLATILVLSDKLALMIDHAPPDMAAVPATAGPDRGLMAV